METKYSEFEILVEYEDSFETSITFQIKASQNGEYVIFPFRFYEFMNQLRKIEPEVANYIDKLRDSLKGYGTKEEEVVDILEEEGFDFEKYFIMVIESYDNYVGKEIARMKKIYTNPESLAALEKLRDVFESTKPKHSELRYSVILDSLEKAIVKHLVDTYPEIMESNPENILKLQEIVESYVPDLGDDVISLIEDIRDELDEAYEQNLENEEDYEDEENEEDDDEDEFDELGFQK